MPALDPGREAASRSKAGGEVDRLRVRIEKDLVRVETVEFESALRLRAAHRIRIVLRAAEQSLGNPAMPDPRRLVAQVIEAISENRVYQIRFCVKQQRNFFRVLGVKSEVPRLGLLNPSSAQGKRSSLHRGPVRRLFCRLGHSNRVGPGFVDSDLTERTDEFILAFGPVVRSFPALPSSRMRSTTAIRMSRGRDNAGRPVEFV